ncbi:hypothetical protein Salat_1203700 [Sesamum alatum]|uniref:Uncharacterized protein n=1 Tax=Sesamum alatum TaxID=300844 RepID=A0AAE1YFD0_9LAMI|nr:hypothetical protein Salat_1202700 [Sesamum alatum]KAK4429037.1 hypothetical protein Salat_1203700 [Sesamum alatum]
MVATSNELGFEFSYNDNLPVVEVKLRRGWVVWLNRCSRGNGEDDYFALATVDEPGANYFATRYMAYQGQHHQTRIPEDSTSLAMEPGWRIWVQHSHTIPLTIGALLQRTFQCSVSTF